MVQGRRPVVRGDRRRVRTRIDGTSTEEQWFGVIDGREVAWLQTYELTAFPEYAEACAAVGVDPAGAGLDYLVADPAARGRGLGSLVIRAFVEQVVFGGHPGWPVVCAGPSPGNVGSRRALEKAGFRFAGLIDTEDGPEHLMAIERHDFPLGRWDGPLLG